jgi:hypothetical protein
MSVHGLNFKDISFFLLCVSVGRRVLCWTEFEHTDGGLFTFSLRAASGRNTTNQTTPSLFHSLPLYLSLTHTHTLGGFGEILTIRAAVAAEKGKQLSGKSWGIKHHRSPAAMVIIIIIATAIQIRIPLEQQQQ